ncbi:hypothetical protein EW145_g4810 [Phellinidium pouzarii]|uniref:RNA polymerase II-associated protein n=1 Tax=Phellinidium pouzarii TaxID=167371 RepID=A0A4S4L277_9AGAM|nr:hypothetical protein EW145_g4810 [Phellinidium pouzarii]
MSVKKSKLDLLHKVRFQNPLPPPPFPPKLLNIPTKPSRYAGPDFTASLAGETPLPMVVDAELGMPLDLSFYDCLWSEDADESLLNPEPNMAPPVDPKDAFMLGDSSLHSLHASLNGQYSSGAAPPTPQVSWLRKTEYISSAVSKTPTSSHDSRRTNEDTTVVDISRAAQIRDVEASFSGGSFNLASLKHPNKPGITAVESYEILPDADIWANAYDLFRFSERPGERPQDVPDPRLDCAILRPMESDGDHFLAYYLPKEDEVAENFAERRRNGEDVEDMIFSFVRDYETVKIEQDVPNEFLLILDNGDMDELSSADSSRRRTKGAYYKNIERKIVLKKKRANQWDTYTDKWDAINLSLATFSTEDLEEREEALAEVVDPLYMFSRADADADGEADETEVNVDAVGFNGYGEGISEQ